MNPLINISECDIDEVVKVLQQIPEFAFNRKSPQSEKKWIEERLKGVEHILLLAKVNEEIAGVKVGYNRWNDGSFYSWLGGVLPKHRRIGVAKALALKQEEMVKSLGYKSIVFKTRNRFRTMILFGISNGFDIVKVTRTAEITDYRIYLQKFLE